MAPAALLSLRDRLPPPAAPRPPGSSRPEVRRALALATGLFGVGTAALVLATPRGLVVEASAGAGAEGAVAAACRLFEVLAASEPPADGGCAGVLEEIVPSRGFAAATPVLSGAGRCLGAVCLIDGARRRLLTGLQRRLFAEFGGLLAPALDPARGAGGPAPGATPAAEAVDRAA